MYKLSAVDKLVLEHLGKTPDDVTSIESIKLWGKKYRINLYEGEKISESYFAEIDDKVISCVKD